MTQSSEEERQLIAFRAECEKVGIPYDAPGLVRHHRGDAGLAAANWQAVVESQRDKALARLRAADDLIANWMSTSNPILHSAAGQLRKAIGPTGDRPGS